MLFPTSITIVITYGILFFLNEEKSLHPSPPFKITTRKEL